jgi:hypothetical protein
MASQNDWTAMWHYPNRGAIGADEWELQEQRSVRLQGHPIVGMHRPASPCTRGLARDPRSRNCHNKPGGKGAKGTGAITTQGMAVRIVLAGALGRGGDSSPECDRIWQRPPMSEPDDINSLPGYPSATTLRGTTRLLSHGPTPGLLTRSALALSLRLGGGRRPRRLRQPLSDSSNNGIGKYWVGLT